MFTEHPFVPGTAVAAGDAPVGRTGGRGRWANNEQSAATLEEIKQGRDTDPVQGFLSLDGTPKGSLCERWHRGTDQGDGVPGSKRPALQMDGQRK